MPGRNALLTRGPNISAAIPFAQTAERNVLSNALLRANVEDIGVSRERTAELFKRDIAADDRAQTAAGQEAQRRAQVETRAQAGEVRDQAGEARAAAKAQQDFDTNARKELEAGSEAEREEALRVARQTLAITDAEQFAAVKAQNPIDFADIPAFDSPAFQAAQRFSEVVVGTLDPEGVLKQQEFEAKQNEVGPLQEIFNPDSPTGTTFVPRDQAVGQPGKPPSGIDITTNADGTTVRTNVRRGGQPGLQKTTVASLEKEIITAQDSQARLNTVAAGFRPEFLQFSPRFDAAVTAFREKANLKVTPEEQKFLAEFATFKRDAIEQINLEIKRITGAQMSEAEADRIRQGFPDPGEGIFDGDSPTEFKSKIDGVFKQLRLAGARKIFTLRNGIDFQSIEIGAMESIIREKAKSLSNQGLSDQDIKAQLKQEFGL